MVSGLRSAAWVAGVRRRNKPAQHNAEVMLTYYGGCRDRVPHSPLSSRLRVHASRVAIDSSDGLATRRAEVAPVGLHSICIDVVSQIHFQNVVLDAAHQLGVLYRNHDFYPAVQVARHQVGASDVNLLPPAV